MGGPGVALTAIKGGINRLRIKGAARQDVLYDLLNGYVTMANTIKVKPGSIRSTFLDPAKFVNTFGLVAYQGSRHVFSEQSGNVPGGYTLHVLNHPAATQKRLATSSTTFTMAGSGANSHGVLPATVSNGFQKGVAGSGDSGFGTGSISAGVTQIALSDIVAAAYTVPSSSSQSGAYPIRNGQNGFVFGLAGTQSQTLLNTISWTDSNGLHTLNGADAVFDNTTYPGFSYWFWQMSTSPNLNGNFVFSISAYQSTLFIDKIPLKEIHFAAPFMGFLYVVAEFTNDGGSGLGTVFHYWLQTSGTWKAATVYKVGQIVSPTVSNGFNYQAVRVSAPNPVWVASTQHVLNDIIEPTVPNGFFYTETAVAGANPQTGLTEPVWPASEGSTISEDAELLNTGVVTTPAPQPSPTSPGAGSVAPGKYGNPYAGVS